MSPVSKIEKSMLFDKSQDPRQLPLPRFLPVFGFQYRFPLLYHAPIRIKVVREVYPAGEKEQAPGCLGALQEPSLLVRAGNPCPLRRTQKIVGSRPCPKEINIHG